MNSIDSMQLARPLLRNLGFEANPTQGEKFVGDQFNYYIFSHHSTGTKIKRAISVLYLSIELNLDFSLCNFFMVLDAVVW